MIEGTKLVEKWKQITTSLKLEFLGCYGQL